MARPAGNYRQFDQLQHGKMNCSHVEVAGVVVGSLKHLIWDQELGPNLTHNWASRQSNWKLLLSVSLPQGQIWQYLNFELYCPTATVFKQKKKKQKMLLSFYFPCSLALYFSLPCIIIEFYILIDKIKWNESLITPTGLSRNMEMWVLHLRGSCVCVSAHVRVYVSRPMKRPVWLNIFNWTMLDCLAWKRMSGLAKDKNNATMSIFT